MASPLAHHAGKHYLEYASNYSPCHNNKLQPYSNRVELHHSGKDNQNDWLDNDDGNLCNSYSVRYPLHPLLSENCICVVNGNYHEPPQAFAAYGSIQGNEETMVCLCFVCSKHYGVNSCHGETCQKVEWDIEDDANSQSDSSSLSYDHTLLRKNLLRKELFKENVGSHSSESFENLESVNNHSYCSTSTIWDPSLQDELPSVYSGSRESSISNSVTKSTIRKSLKVKSMSKSLQKPSVPAVIPLRPSLFTDVPPTLFFFKTNEEVIPLPAEIRKLLVWKLSTITPIIIRQTVVRTGYQLTRKNSDWVAMWGKHMKSLQFQELKECQKVNHFPGSHNLGRKDNLLRNIRRARNIHGESTYNFLPETYILPKDIRLLRKAWERHIAMPGQLWIVKPPASARGTGIHLINKWNQVPKKQSAIVQKYIVNPYLINGSKFDLRIYVLVSSFNPLRIYIFDNGLVRFASVKYSQSSSSIENKFMHLTNYSINKTNSLYASNESENACEGHKWTLKALWGYLARRNINVERLWENIEDIVIKTIICAESGFNRLIDGNVSSRYMCFELFGFDIMLDANLRPWLLEVNISPSLHSSSKLDTAVKGQLVTDMLNIVGFHIPDKLSAGMQYTLLQKLGLSSKTRRLCLNRVYYQNSLSPEEKTKHDLIEEMGENKLQQFNILDDLTPDDLRHLMQGEDEATRTGHFTRIFPSATSLDYYKLMRVKRYYNALQLAWEIQYNCCRKAGVARLQALCRKGTHLKAPKKTSIGKEPVVTVTTPDETESLAEKKPKVKALKLTPVFKIPNRIKVHALTPNKNSPGMTFVKSHRTIRKGCFNCQ